MTATEPVGDLERHRDLRFQRREWTVQRAGWLVMLAFVLAALSGLFGGGPLSAATAKVEPLQLQYTRFERRHAPTELEVSVATSAVSQDQVEVWFSPDYLARIEITSIVPEPEEVSETNDRVIYRFNIDEQTRAPRILVALEHDEPGLTTGRIGLIDGPELAFWQVVYP
jgi:hypothetical protein